MSNGTDLEPLDLELLGKPHAHGLVPLKMNPSAERIRPPRRPLWQRAVKKKMPEPVPKPKRFDGAWDLDAPLIEFARGEFWTIRDSFQGTLVTGRPGSGKTSASGRTLANAFLKKGYGGLVLCAKNSEADLWRSYLKETGRIDDGVFFGPDEPWRFNFLDHESRAKGNGLDHLDNLSTLFLDILEVKKESASGDVDAAFWLPQKKALLRGLFGLILLSQKPITLGLMNDIIASSARDPDEAESKKWRSKSLLFRLLAEAETLNGEHPEMKHVGDYWMVHRPGMHSLAKTRESIDLQIRGLTDSGLSRGKLGELLGTVTNVTPDDCFSGKVLVINLPVSEYRDEGKYAASIFTSAFYRATLRRKFTPPNDRPVFLFADEAQTFTTEEDSDYHAVCRSYGVACVRMTQNIPVFRLAYGGAAKAELKVDAILGTLSTKLMHSNDCPVTSAWASKIVAREVANKMSISGSGQGQNHSMTLSEDYQESLPPETFLDLKTGGNPYRKQVEAVLFESGRVWKRDRRWIVRTFVQA